MHRAHKCLIAGLVGATMASAPCLAWAQEDDASVRAYWTPERLAKAVPMQHHPVQVWPNGLPVGAGQPNSGVPASSGTVSAVPKIAGATLPPIGQAAPPTDPTEWPQQLYAPKPTNAPGAVHVSPAASNAGYYYTTTRVFPTDSEVKNFPYRAAGHLFFTITKSGGVDKPGDYNCTASVIKARIVATAGHCVGSPQTATGGHFSYYSKWLFVPADMDGTAPYGSWTVAAEGISSSWSNGNGAVPNSEDWGFLEMNDQSGVTIAAKVGHLGYYTGQLTGNNETVLGYPGNLDGGNYMQQTQAQIATSGGSNTFLIGSAMGPGASGGPWIMDFGDGATCSSPCVSASGSPNVNAMGANYLTGVTSYGPTKAVGYLGASNLNSDWLNLLTKMCNLKSGNC